MGAASTPDSPRALVRPVRRDPGAESRRRASPVSGHGADFSMRVAQMLMGPINMSSNAVGRKQGRDYNFRAARGPPDQPLLGGDSGQESLGYVRPPDSAGSRQGSRWRGEGPAPAFEDARVRGCVLATTAGRGCDVRGALSLPGVITR